MNRVAAAARACVGVGYRPQGRDPASALDCIGLVAVALTAAGVRVTAPRGYALRGGDPDEAAAALAAMGLRPVADARAGDVLVCRSGPGALHLGIDGGGSVIHADLTARRVVERPGAAPWPVIARYRWEG